MYVKYSSSQSAIVLISLFQVILDSVVVFVGIWMGVVGECHIWNILYQRKPYLQVQTSWYFQKMWTIDI